MSNQTLGDVTCWLEQVEGIIDLVTTELDRHKNACGSSVALSLHGAATLITQARKAVDDEHLRLLQEGR